MDNLVRLEWIGVEWFSERSEIQPCAVVLVCWLAVALAEGIEKVVGVLFVYLFLAIYSARYAYAGSNSSKAVCLQLRWMNP